MKWTLLTIFLLWTSQSFGQERAPWKPDFVATQYAGSIGFMSGGFGYYVVKNKATLSLHYGFVPAAKGGPFNIISTKFLFNGFRINVSDRLELLPLSAGIMISYHFGEELNSSWSEFRYPKGYYWWRPSIIAHINTQTSLTLKLDEKLTVKSITGFIDLNTNHLYMVSYFPNMKSLSLSDIIKVGYGVRLNF